MTWHEWAVKYLEARGMFAQQAEDVVAAAKSTDAMEAFADRWADQMSGYPTSLGAVVTIGLRAAARAWIEDHCPRAWYRPLFAEAEETTQEDAPAAD